MTNSFILRGTAKLILWVWNAIKHSIFLGWVSRFDEFLTRAAVDSVFFRMIAGKNGPVSRSAGSSLVYRLVNKIWDITSKGKPYLEAGVTHSSTVGVIVNVIEALRGRPLKLLGLLGAAFVAPNILFELISGSAGFPEIGLKILLMAVFLLFYRVDADLKSLVKGSRFVRMAGWIFRYED